jgi:hypothetical protein
MKLCSAIWVLVLVGLCGVNIVQMAKRVPAPSRSPADAPPPDAVMQQERRFAQLKSALASRGVPSPVGYLADIPSENLVDDPGAIREYLISQFVLVPWVIDGKREDCAWAIGNFHLAANFAKVPDGFRVAEDFGSGVLLFQKLAP